MASLVYSLAIIPALHTHQWNVVLTLRLRDDWFPLREEDENQNANLTIGPNMRTHSLSPVPRI